ncbi:lipase member H [Megalopta genalis]|uniref:lipase member H n=1 Tax=Megalopta genalis TaxID=115081 RepID=UPI003FD0FF8A
MTNYRFPVIFAVCCCFFTTTVLSSDLGTIELRLYFRNGTHKQVNASKAGELVRSLNLQAKTLIHCHGFRQSTDSDDVVSLMKGYLAGSNYNVIAVDYRHVSYKDYLSAVILANDVATVIVQSINDMVAAGMNQTKLVASGFSLGAQICGVIGRKLPFELPEIIAGDPAGPLFYFFDKSISASDATCVKCIHTDMRFYGTGDACDYIDFYPNGGSREQPGCLLFSLQDLTNSCSHSRAEKYMIEAARHPNAFPSVKCDSWDDFKNGKCNRNITIPMGESARCSVTGKFYLQTNSASPFAKGSAGTFYH